jgi:hypothetical protein
MLEILRLKVGDDIQRDETCLESAAILMGGLSDLLSLLCSNDSQSQKLIWAERGKEILAEKKSK